MGFEVCGLHEALVKTGIGIEKPRIIIGGYCYIFPFQKVCFCCFLLNCGKDSVIMECAAY